MWFNVSYQWPQCNLSKNQFFNANQTTNRTNYLIMLCLAVCVRRWMMHRKKKCVPKWWYHNWYKISSGTIVWTYLMTQCKQSVETISLRTRNSPSTWRFGTMIYEGDVRWWQVLWIPIVDLFSPFASQALCFSPMPKTRTPRIFVAHIISVLRMFLSGMSTWQCIYGSICG